ncbi:MAG TPA: c-type cytochrome [Candidimonas sp.]|nr:c-type cytochrome [Candidimonas sp.]
MKKLITHATLLGLVALSPPAQSQMGMMGRGMMGMSMVRHHFAMTNGINPAYASKENPLQPNVQTIESGKNLFEQNCARCNGAAGRGDGPDGKNLVPPPANIAAISKMPMATDGYLYWTITEGGVPLGTGMPPFGTALKEEDIWKIITYLRVL